MKLDFIMGDKTDQLIPIIQDRHYPLCTSLPSYIKLAQAAGNNIELKSQYISMFPKFNRSDS